MAPYVYVSSTIFFFSQVSSPSFHKIWYFLQIFPILGPHGEIRKCVIVYFFDVLSFAYLGHYRYIILVSYCMPLKKNSSQNMVWPCRTKPWKSNKIIISTAYVYSFLSLELSYAIFRHCLRLTLTSFCSLLFTLLGSAVLEKKTQKYNFGFLRNSCSVFLRNLHCASPYREAVKKWASGSNILFNFLDFLVLFFVVVVVAKRKKNEKIKNQLQM